MTPETIGRLRIQSQSIRNAIVMGGGNRVTMINGTRIIWRGQWASERQWDDFVPVCAWCKRIRNGDTWYHGWHRRTPTHGICPECQERVMGDAAEWAERRAG